MKFRKYRKRYLLHYNKVNFADSISAGDFVDFVTGEGSVEIPETSQTIFPT